MITSDPAIKLGRPVVAGTRVTVDEVLDQLAAGATIAEIIESHPGLEVEGIMSALAFAADAVRDDSPLEKTSPLDLHGPHVVSIPDASTGTNQNAIAVRAFLPDATAVSVRRLLPAPPPAGRAWFPGLEPATPGPEPDAVELPTLHPMERVHPAGVFEALFPGETEPFPYQLAVTSDDGETRLIDAPHALPPYLASGDLPPFAESASRDAGSSEHARRACRWHELLGAHPVEHAGLKGTAFAVWAPNAASVSVIGDFNQWDALGHPMRPVDITGVWELFVPGLGEGALYKYRITSRDDGRQFDRADPYAFAAELRPRTASVVWNLNRHQWHDEEWLKARPQRQASDSPIAIYEVHLGSWRRSPAANGGGAPRWLTYRELADKLVPYVKEMGYTHIEPMPVAEHPFDGSWGYQITGFFAPTARYGSPDDFRYFVDTAHQAGLGVIMDWVPGHFPKDAHGLALFDGSHLYEHADPRRSENLEWGTLSFNLARDEVSAFLLSNALFWVEQYHVDGLRVDAVSSMVYLDYSRQHWVPNEFGGRENLEATAFLQRLNNLMHREHPGVLMIAEESTAWPHVTGREIPDSLGFDLKWNLGWMHDTLGYAQRDPLFRRHHHHNLTFSLTYAFSESFLLPLSHDEVVHGKRSLLSKMPGDSWQQFANLRALYGYMYAHPGKKLHFMGSEFGPRLEWNHDTELDWTLLEHEPHAQLRAYVKELNRLYAAHPALHEVDFSWAGFQWLDCDDADRSIVSFLRRGRNDADFLVVVVNFTPVPRADYRLGVPVAGCYTELLNSDAAAFGGSNRRNPAHLPSESTPVNGQPHSVAATLPPLGIAIFARDAD
ncbi:MAG: 1,4-alpha-glucan branching protein GlgB [Verrucomicrobia bacterium]|nr:1,4-alpha-glucan branching protein GlgB [Verrucomicrobiota bacterium]